MRPVEPNAAKRKLHPLILFLLAINLTVFAYFVMAIPVVSPPPYAGLLIYRISTWFQLAADLSLVLLAAQALRSINVWSKGELRFAFQVCVMIGCLSFAQVMIACFTPPISATRVDDLVAHPNFGILGSIAVVVVGKYVFVSRFREAGNSGQAPISA